MAPGRSRRLPRRAGELCPANDLARGGPELEGHRVFELGVTKPIEPEPLELCHPAARHVHALELGFFVLAALAFVPFPDAAATRVARRIDVKRDAIDMIGDLSVHVGVALAPP